MAIRTALGVVMMASILFIGAIAVSESSQQNQPTNSTEADQAAQQMAEGVFEGIFSGVGPGMIWMGVAAIILVALGLLVAAYSGGGR